jgi:hypothetical protein
MRAGLVLPLFSLCLTLPVAFEGRQASLASDASHAASGQEGEDPYIESNARFQKRLKAYLDLRNAISKKVPEVKETGDPAKISGREKALGQAIAAARSSAKPGDIFGPDMSRYLTQLVADDWKARSPADRKALFNELPPGVRLTVNQPYPTTLPLVSVPAKLLAVLPMLPEELEYRLIDRNLLLRDRDANLIVDVLAGVRPGRS